ncbi:TPA: hypothetical protein U2M34_000375 [Providencia rettgeri]|nr:hypothetical protein [Providencia rettgeri]
MNIRAILLTLIFVSFNNLADENICQKSKLISEQEGAIINSFKSGYKVIGNGRAHFYYSPNVNCKEKNLFLIKDDLVNASIVYDDFTSIMYLNKNGQVIDGWIKSNRLTPTGTGIGPSDENR